MKELREQMQQHGFVPLEMRFSELPPQLRSPESFKYVQMRRAHIFNRQGEREPTTTEMKDIRRILADFVGRQKKNSKAAYFYQHPENGPKAWILVTQ